MSDIPPQGKPGGGDQDLLSDSDAQEDEDPYLRALLRENSEVESSSGEEGSGELKPQVRTKKRDPRKYEGPVSTIAVLVVSLWTLRIPVLYRDLVWYVNPRAG